MNNDTIKIQKIKGYTKLINEVQELMNYIKLVANS